MRSPGHLIAGPEDLNKGQPSVTGCRVDSFTPRQPDGRRHKQYMFYNPGCGESAMIFVKRYAEAVAAKASECKDPARKAELLFMADGLENLSENPARNFWEACQGTIMYQLLITLETLIPSPSFGRFDQYTWPFLKKDLEDGKITLDQAQRSLTRFLKATASTGRRRQDRRSRASATRTSTRR